LYYSDEVIYSIRAPPRHSTSEREAKPLRASAADCIAALFFKQFTQLFYVNNPFEISVIIPMKIHNISKVQLAFYGKLHCDVLQYNM